MSIYSNWFHNSIWDEIHRENMKKYGTGDYEEIMRMEEYANKKVEAEVDSKVKAKLEELLPEVQKNAHKEAIQKVRAEELVKKGTQVLSGSVFFSETIVVDGKEIIPHDIIPRSFTLDQSLSERQLELNPYNLHWERKFKTKASEYVSDINVVACSILYPTTAGAPLAFATYITRRDNPLIFNEGDFSTQRIMKKLQLENTSADSKWVADAFRKSLRMCTNINFCAIPSRMGGFPMNDGSLVYVSSLSVIQGLEECFPDEIKEHTLVQHDREHDVVFEEYRCSLPNNIKMKLAVVHRVMSIFLPFFETEGLRPDKATVISYKNEQEKQLLIALSKRINYSSTVVQSLSVNSNIIKSELQKWNDATILFTYSSTMEKRGRHESAFTDIRHDLQRENGVENPNRKVIIILTETPGSIPGNFPAYYFLGDEDVECVDVAELQRLSGEFDYSLIKFLYDNQDVAKQLVHDAVEEARSKIVSSGLEPSSTKIMNVAIALVMQKARIFTDSDISEILLLFSSGASTLTSSNEVSCKEIGRALSESICRGELDITRQYEPPFYKSNGHTAFIAEIDNTINLEVDTFDKILISDIKSTDVRSKAIAVLEEQGLLIPVKEHKRDLKVKFENREIRSVRVYSLSSALLDEKSRLIVEKALASDMFRQPDNSPEHFYPLIRHKELDLVAGQIISDYSRINPFVCVTGSPGSGKTDLLQMQALMRARKGDTVVVLDQTNAFCQSEFIVHKFPQELVDEFIEIWDMSVNGWPIALMDFSECESDEQKIQRLSSLLKSGSHITGSNQLSILQNATEKIVKSIDKSVSVAEYSKWNVKSLIESVMSDKGKEGEVKRRLLSMFNTVAGNAMTPPGWESILSKKGKIIVISAGNAVSKSDANPLDIVLDSFYCYKDKHRDGNVTLILDEVQRMNLSEGAPIDVILSTGRKLNISVFLASQRYSDDKDKLGHIEEYCGTKIFYCPMDSCMRAVSKTTHLNADTLQNFEQGDCAVVGPIYSEYCGKNFPVRKAILGKTYRPPEVGEYEEN